MLVPTIVFQYKGYSQLRPVPFLSNIVSINSTSHIYFLIREILYTPPQKNKSQMFIPHLLSLLSNSFSFPQLQQITLQQSSLFLWNEFRQNDNH